MRMTLLDLLAFLVLLLVWAFNFIFAKVGLAQIPAMEMLTLRFILAVALLSPFLRLEGVPIARIAVLSLTLATLHFGLLFSGLEGVAAGPASVASQLFVPFGVLLARVVYGERMKPWQIVGMAVAFAGVYVLGGEPETAPSLPHFLMVVAAAFALAVATIQIKGLGPINIFTLNAWIALFAIPQVALASALFEDHQLSHLASADWRGWGAVAFMAVGGTITGHGLWYHLVRKYPVNRMMPPTLLTPTFAMFLAVWLLDEPLTTRTLLGAALTISGVGMIHLFHARHVEVPAP